MALFSDRFFVWCVFVVIAKQAPKRTVGAFFSGNKRPSPKGRGIIDLYIINDRTA
jgi:hypothetical protein